MFILISYVGVSDVGILLCKSEENMGSFIQIRQKKECPGKKRGKDIRISSERAFKDEDLIVVPGILNLLHGFLFALFRLASKRPCIVNV